MRMTLAPMATPTLDSETPVPPPAHGPRYTLYTFVLPCRCSDTQPGGRLRFGGGADGSLYSRQAPTWPRAAESCVCDSAYQP